VTENKKVTFLRNLGFGEMGFSEVGGHHRSSSVVAGMMGRCAILLLNSDIRMQAEWLESYAA